MLEVLAAATGVELGKLILEQVLNLGKAALEDYVKDFFKDCIQSGVALANADTLKKPMAEAIGFFIKRFIKELQFNDVSETSIEHHFKATIKRFVRDKAVRPILGKAFEKDCKQINYAQLEQIWTQQYQVDGWQFPAEEFDWRRVAKEYVLEVQGIIKADAELRSLLDTELLEEIARNTAQLSPGFDVAKYRESLQCSYGYLKLYTLDSTDRTDTIKLWNMFIEQTVREALPPMRYELPSDLKRQLQEQGQLDDLSPEALEHYRHEYFQQPARKVLEAVIEAHHAVILGDPGAGKSTLLQYLALEWVEGKTETLPLLIELREYVLAQSTNFLDFLYRGRGADWQFDQQQLHQYLSDNLTLIMFDGLDEVFDRPTQSAVIDDIIRFAQQYPKAKVLVTSRIIGYNPERFQHAGFLQFTIQSLDETEIHEFIDRWYDLAMGSDLDKVRLKQRLKEAIANSKAIANLADNPLLLTMMAILNRRQELPRDRADLYDQASRVLLYHWDVDHHKLQLPLDAIGRREKQEMLRLIAYEMQAGDKGLKGNLIGVDRLTQILTNYLRDQGFSEPREKASQLIQQLRERNFILCYRGTDTYGFVHRTFLEYFCAMEIVNRFEKQRSISFEQLRDEIFGQHWQDETWHEILRLICGTIDVKFAEILIDFLIGLKLDQALFLEEMHGKKRLILKGLANLILAIECFSEISYRHTTSLVEERLIEALKRQIEQSEISFSWEVAYAIAQSIKFNFPSLLSWLRLKLQECSESPPVGLDEYLQQTAVDMVAGYYANLPNTKVWLQELADGKHWAVRYSATIATARYYQNSDTLVWLKAKLFEDRGDHNTNVRYAALQAIAQFFKDEPEIFEMLCDVIQNDLFIIRENDWQWYLRQLALEAFLTHYPTHPKTIELLRDRAINDPDEQLRDWAQQQLERLGQKEESKELHQA